MENAWNEVDYQLNEHGELLLFGAVACFSLSPLICAISAFALLSVVAVKQEPRAKQWGPNILKENKIRSYQDFLKNRET